MYEDVVALIPIRAGSKGLPNKNILSIAGKPLFQHTVDAARAAGIGKIVITTDIKEVLEADLGPDVIVERRPDTLSTDATPIEQVLCHILSKSHFDSKTTLLLQATSPLRPASAIRECLDLFLNKDFDLVFAVNQASSTWLKSGFIKDGAFSAINKPDYLFSNRQHLPDLFKPNGAIYVFAASWFLTQGGFSNGSFGAYIMDKTDSLDIDNIKDFQACEAILKARNS